MATINIDPVTRIEGHLKVEVVTDGGEVKEARCSGTLYRGFEQIMVGRDPLDAPIITQRVCGVCPAVHATASAQAVDAALGIAGNVPDNGRIMRNLILGANYLQSHILHFYHLAALDYVDVTKVARYRGSDPTLRSVKDFIRRGELAPFVPRYEGDYRLADKVDREAVAHYVQALDMRRRAHEMLAVFGGKMPHQCGIVAGGVTSGPNADQIADFLWRLNQIRGFIDSVYLPDVIAVAKAYADYAEIGNGVGRWLAYGVFDMGTTDAGVAERERFMPQGVTDSSLQVADVDDQAVSEEVTRSWYRDGGAAHPSAGETVPEPDKAAGYSWLKAPRYNGKPYEVGPAARMIVGYIRGVEPIKSAVEGLLAKLGLNAGALNSVLGRHAARALEAKLVADEMAEWVTQLKPGEPFCAAQDIPEAGQGAGMADGPRGALGHWVSLDNSRVNRYQLVVPTTWNASPADGTGQPGPIEQALLGTKIRDEANPFEVVRIVRSFDPCLACAVHLITPAGDELSRLRVL
ncbi:MAG: nickel-dependent hydrogenase large subunit [Armatimonadota bacterium]|nr:MAG: nickel-dependent hydrogenase large subunit [Armatimonadota bacterium]